MAHRKIIRPLLQEIYQEDPWKMLVCCILLNLTKRQQVDGVRHELFSKYPTEYEMMEADEDELSEILKPLGLYRRRAKTLIKFSWMWVCGFNDVKELHGIGQYAKDSWEIFQNNNRNVNPTDKVLLSYLSVTK
jgi:methyl-CpG-binding domain protein 4|tara:strand:+ start:98 stop:496 length:399 start_codon:yes stop_codon:yes gene_type:complete